MSQLNMHITTEFNRSLQQLMKLRGYESKAEAIRAAVTESLTRAKEESQKQMDFKNLIGCALRAPLNKKAKHLTDDDLWEKKGW